MTTKHTPSRLQTAATLLAAGLAASMLAGGLSGCRGQRSAKPPRQFIPDMDDSPKSKAQSQTAFFQDGRSMRPAVAGTVAFGADMDPEAPTRANYLKDNTLVYEGYDPAKPKTTEGDLAWEAVIPAAAVDQWIAEANVHGGGFNAADAGSRTSAMTAMIKRGQERFNIYCSACHGYAGDGQGLVGQRWGYPVPSFHDAKYKDRALKTGKDGYLFSVIRHGVPAADPVKEAPKMPSYADKVSVSDSWAIIAYMRALQSARTEAPASAAAPPVESAAPLARRPDATSQEAAK
jgi:mono/diheme cytochrome c family protein